MTESCARFAGEPEFTESDSLDITLRNISPSPASQMRADISLNPLPGMASGHMAGRELEKRHAKVSKSQ